MHVPTYIKLQIVVIENPKVVELNMHYGSTAGIGNYVTALCLIAKRDDRRIRISRFPFHAARNFFCNLEQLQEFIDMACDPDCNLLQTDGEYVYCEQLDDYLDAYDRKMESSIEGGKKGADARWNKGCNRVTHGVAHKWIREYNKEYDLLLMTETEHGKLIEKYGAGVINKCLLKLNAYIGSTGKRYKSHYRTALVWLQRDNAELITSCPSCHDKHWISGRTVMGKIEKKLACNKCNEGNKLNIDLTVTNA